MRERWRKVQGAPGYQVSDRGRVRSITRRAGDGRMVGGRMLAQWPDRDGYLTVKIGAQPAAVHLLVLEAFHGPRPAGMEGCHGPAGQHCNWAGNLRWDTHLENERDKKRAGRDGWMGTCSPPLPVVTSVTRDQRQR